MKQNSFLAGIMNALMAGAILLIASPIIAQNPFPATAITLYTSTSAYATSPLNAFATNNCTTGSQDLRGQCTWYVNARLQELRASGHLVSTTVNSIQTALCNATGRHAKNWDNIIGGTWYSTSTSALPLAQRNPGMIVVWDNDPNNSNSTLYGHVGFVEEISADKSMYRVSEFNWCNNNCRLYNGGNTWLPFDGNDSRLGVYPKFYAVGLNTTATPVTNAPSGTNIQIPVNFSWGSVTGTGVEYRIQVSTSNSGWTAQNGFSSSTSCGSTLVVNKNTGSSSSFSWSVITTGVCFAPQPGTTYYWTVKAYTPAGGNSAYSTVKTFTTASSSTVTTPTSVNASDGSYPDKVRITFSGSSGNYFRVYRNTANNSSTATALGSWQTSTTYDDFSAVAGTTYYYWVRAASNSSGSNASAYGGPNTGYRAATVTVTTPTSVNASDGSYPDKVRITFSGSSGNYFRVYRNTANNSSTATALGSWQTSTTYDDFSAVAGTTYYYWVRAASNSSGSNASAYGGPNTGYRAATVTVTTPTSVNASDGSYPDKVRITFSGSSGNYFRVYRNTANNSSTATALGSWQTSTTYDDFSAVAGTTYYYWVRAASNSSGSNASAYGGPNTGYRAASAPSAPANDNPCSATTIVAGSLCSNSSGTTVGATNTTNPAAPTSCPFYGKDVWYKVQVPSTGVVTIRTTAGTLNDLVMAIYYGSCSALQGIVCEDDNTNGNGSMMPVITISGYSVGTWLYIRVWGYSGATGTFNICALNYSIASLSAPESGTVNAQPEPLVHIFPNPSAGDVTLQYDLKEPSRVGVMVYDLTGKLVLSVPENQVDSGVFTQDLDLYFLPEGAYFVKVSINDSLFTEKMLLTRH